jgi:tetratricopeptide (TPR) repeat protein
MKRISILLGVIVLVAAGCATGKRDAGAALGATTKPAWSLKSSQDEMVVAASPMRRTLQIAGSTGFVVGLGVDFVVNSEYRDAVRQALQGYDTNAAFASYIEKRMKEALPNAVSVAPLQSAAGYPNEQEARQARYRSLAREGYDAVLDLKFRYGLYGTNVELVTEIDANLVAVPSGKTLWSDTVYASPEPSLASDRLGNPQKKKRSNESAPQFSVDQAAFARWTANNGQLLRASYEQGVQGVTEALLSELGVATSALGELYLGKVAMNDKNLLKANEHFEKALRIDPNLVEARNAQSVAYAQDGQLDTAIQLAQSITKSNPDFAPAWYNLAWWNAVERKDAAAAQPYYAEATRLGMPADPKIEKALAEK